MLPDQSTCQPIFLGMLTFQNCVGNCGTSLPPGPSLNTLLQVYRSSWLRHMHGFLLFLYGRPDMISPIFKSAAKMEFCISTGMKSRKESESHQQF